MNTLNEKLAELMGIVKGFVRQLLILRIVNGRNEMAPKLSRFYTLSPLAFPEKLADLGKGLRYSLDLVALTIGAGIGTKEGAIFPLLQNPVQLWNMPHILHDCIPVTGESHIY
jgi:hypothetical protein